MICFHCPGSTETIYQGYPETEFYHGSSRLFTLRIAEDGNTLVLKHRICCAETVIRLDKRVFSRRNIDAKLKGHFIDSAVFASLLYGLEHCAFGPRDQRCLDGFFLVISRNVYYFCHSIITYPMWKQNNRLVSREALKGDDTVLYEALIFIPNGGQTTPSVLRHNQGRRKEMSSLITADRNNFGQTSPQSKRPSTGTKLW